ncbi:MAG: molybdopterin oxidoreductase [Gammaproteobacteria bacterium]
MLLETPKFLQGVYPFEGRGLDNLVAFDPKVAYVVPPDKRVRPFYFRAGNSSPEMIYLVLMRNDTPMRYCPLGAKGALDVGFHVIEETAPGTVLEVRFAAPQGIKGLVVVDVGLVET